MIVLFVIALLFVGASAQAATRFSQGAFGFYGAGNNMFGSSHCLDGSGSGSIFVTGYTDGTSLGQSSQIGGGDDWFIAKFNKNAGFLTVNSSNPTLRFLLTPGIDQGMACESDTSGAVYVAGSTTAALNNVTRANSQSELVVVKYDSQMNRVWLGQFDFGSHEYPAQILLNGNVLYVIGVTAQSVFLHALNPTTGAELWPRPVVYGSQASTSISVAHATINLLTNDIIVVGRYYGTGGVPGLMNSTGSIAPALPGSSSIYTNGYIASFTSSGAFNWHRAIASPRYDGVTSVATDVSGAVVIGGFVTGRVNDADYLADTDNSPMPFLAKYSVDGVHQWTNILPRNEQMTIAQVLVDGLGGILALRSSAGCFRSTSSNDPVGRDHTCGSTLQGVSLVKANSANGALQYIEPISTGVPLSATLDREGLLTIAGAFLGGSSNNLHGVMPPSNNWYTFIDQQQLIYNCSCDDMDEIVSEMIDLLFSS